jgi:hypothetical protein
MNMCINKEYNTGHSENYGKIKRFNMDSLQGKAKCLHICRKKKKHHSFMPLVISLFANYWHAGQVIYEMITPHA